MVEQGRQGIIGPVSYDEVCAGECCVRKRVRLYSRPGNDLTPRFPTLAGLIGIEPQDEMEGMIAAQLIATHNATMECYRRAMIAEQTSPPRSDHFLTW
jgi:hypothetical protein